MKIGFILSFLLVNLVFISCNPFIIFKPKKIAQNNLSIISQAPGSNSNEVEIILDKFGIPYIKAKKSQEVLFGLGYMHARDRLFQIDLLRHAATGRLAEFFGKESLLDYDRKMRILTYKLDDQVKNLSSAELSLVRSYIKGVNRGAQERGRSAEHFLLGHKFVEFTLRDYVAIARLQAWILAADVQAEFARLKIARANINSDIKNIFLNPVDDRDSAIISGNYEADAKIKLYLPNYISTRNIKPKISNSKPDFTPGSILDKFQTSGGASNAWVISKNYTKSGHALLFSDPHLRHNWPSNFYIASLECDDFQATGATFVGIGGVLIGASKNISWGVTAANINVQDSVLLKINSEDPTKYLVDEKWQELIPWPQKYCTDKNGTCTEEIKYISMFGPVIDHKFNKNLQPGDTLALMWTGFLAKLHTNLTTQFVDLARSQDVYQAVNNIKTMTLPGVNLVVADQQGNIAYSFAGVIPKRDPSQHSYLPLDGTKSSSLWSGVLPKEQEPSLINPTRGYIVTANQSIYSKGNKLEKFFGLQGTPPYRAIRIVNRIEELKSQNKLEKQELAKIQLDANSVEAQELSGYLGAQCQEIFYTQDMSKKSFAQELVNFDGNFTKDSLGALPYVFITKELTSGILRNILKDSKIGDLNKTKQINFVIKNQLRKAIHNKSSLLFENLLSSKNINLSGYISQYCEPAYNKLLKYTGHSASWGWRWGRYHTIKRASPLGGAPVIGTFFRHKKIEIAGTSSAPMAESGLPVTHGANLRMFAELSNPIKINLVIDSGNSGAVGSKHAFDQAKLWHLGKTISMPISFDEAKINAKQNFVLTVD